MSGRGIKQVSYPMVKSTLEGMIPSIWNEGELDALRRTHNNINIMLAERGHKLHISENQQPFQGKEKPHKTVDRHPRTS
jgi:hypothetical protein